MHIGFICNEYPGIGPNGGIGSFTQILGKNIIKKGHTVTVFGNYKTLKKETIINDDGVKAIGLPYINFPKIHWELNRWLLMRRIKFEHKQNPISILEAPDYQGWLRKLNINIPKIIRIHSPQKIGFDRSMDINNLSRTIISEDKSMQYTDYICSCGKSVSEAAKKTYVKYLDLDKPIKVIYNCIDTNFWLHREDKKNESINIVFAGRITVKKGVIELIKAWEKIIEKVPNARLILLGRDSKYGESNSMIYELKQLLPDSIRESVIFRGFLKAPEILKYFQEASICVFPSHREAFCIVVLEAMATGTPVIYSKIKPAYEIIEDGKNGMLCDPHNPEDIVEKIIYLLNNKEMMRFIGINARNHIEKNFSIKSVIDQNLKYYQSCINDYYNK